MPLRKLTGGQYAAVAWQMPDDSIVVVPLTMLEYNRGQLDLRQPPGAVRRIFWAGGMPALDTADGLPHAGDYWEMLDTDPVTEQPVMTLHMQTGDDPLGTWSYTQQRSLTFDQITGKPLTEAAFEVSSKHRDTRTSYSVATADQIAPAPSSRTVFNGVRPVPVAPNGGGASALGGR